MARVPSLGRSQHRDYRLLAFGSSAWNTSITPGGVSGYDFRVCPSASRSPRGDRGTAWGRPESSRMAELRRADALPFDPFAEALAGR